MAQFGTTCMWLLAERNFSLWTAWPFKKELILRFEANQWGKTIKILPRGLLREYGLHLCPRRRQITPKSLVKQLQHSAQIWTPGRNSPWRFASRNPPSVPPYLPSTHLHTYLSTSVHTSIVIWELGNARYIQKSKLLCKKIQTSSVKVFCNNLQSAKILF